MDLPHKNNRNFLTINATDGLGVLKGLSSPVRISILRLLHARGPLNVNEISEALSLPQSTVATNVQVLENCDLIRTETVKATKGQQKICAARFDEIVLRFDDYDVKARSNVVELSMPLGLYTNCSVSPPCGLCSSESVIGLLDVPDFFLDPDRM
ncbi:MAG: ArsR family transcriptional regulator, partial [Mesorhizobium sp.]